MRNEKAISTSAETECFLCTECEDVQSDIHPLVLGEVLNLTVLLFVLFNLSVDTGQLLKDICSLYKKRLQLNIGNYRPISITSQVVKLLVHITQKHQMYFCTHYNIISCEAQGFQQACSYFTQLVKCLHTWITSYDKLNMGVDVINTDCFQYL